MAQPPDPPPPPPSTSVNQHHNRYVIHYLGNKIVFIKSLMNFDQIYSYLLKLKLNLHASEPRGGHSRRVEKMACLCAPCC